MPHKLGPTGKFPLGKLTPDDEGELVVAIGPINGSVAIRFGKPIAFIAFPPTQARMVAEALIKHADALDPLPGPRGKA